MGVTPGPFRTRRSHFIKTETPCPWALPMTPMSPWRSWKKQRNPSAATCWCALWPSQTNRWKKYGGLLRHLTDAERAGNSYEQYVQDAAARRAMGVTRFEEDASGFEADIRLESSTLVFFSVPWDEGWSATVNGQPVQVEKGQRRHVRGGLPGGRKHRAVPLPDARLCAGLGRQPFRMRRVGCVCGRGAILPAQTKKRRSSNGRIS